MNRRFSIAKPTAVLGVSRMVAKNALPMALQRPTAIHKDIYLALMLRYHPNVRDQR